MKFSCDRCGKRYATADRPTPGRIYKLRCKACGHLIVASVPAPCAEPVEEPKSTPAPLAPLAPVGEGRQAGEAAPGSEGPPEERSTGALTPPPRELGYVDLFSDLPELSEPEADDAPFLSAGGGSLPTGGATTTPAGPLARLGQPRPELTPARALAAAARVPALRRPPEQRSSLPLVGMGLGVLLLAGILAFAMLSAGTRAPPEPGVAAAAAPQATRASASR